MQMTTIREMCDLFDVTPRTLRFYEQKGLLSPVRDGTKRGYTDACKARVALILRLKGFGFSLDEIGAAYFDKAGVAMDSEARKRQMAELAQIHLIRMKSERDQLERSIAGLTAAIGPARGMRAFELEGV